MSEGRVVLVHGGRDQGVAAEGVLDAHVPALVVAPAAGEDAGVLQLLAGPRDVVGVDIGLCGQRVP